MQLASKGYEAVICMYSISIPTDSIEGVRHAQIWIPHFKSLTLIMQTGSYRRLALMLWQQLHGKGKAGLCLRRTSCCEK